MCEVTFAPNHALQACKFVMLTTFTARISHSTAFVELPCIATMLSEVGGGGYVASESGVPLWIFMYSWISLSECEYFQLKAPIKVKQEKQQDGMFCADRHYKYYAWRYAI